MARASLPDRYVAVAGRTPVIVSDTPSPPDRFFYAISEFIFKNFSSKAIPIVFHRFLFYIFPDGVPGTRPFRRLTEPN